MKKEEIFETYFFGLNIAIRLFISSVLLLISMDKIIIPHQVMYFRVWIATVSDIAGDWIHSAEHCTRHSSHSSGKTFHL